jgi:hypothetical protein
MPFLRNSTSVLLYICSGVVSNWKLDAGSWILDAGSWMLDAGYWMLEAGYWMLDAGSWKLNTREGQRVAFCTPGAEMWNAACRKGQTRGRKRAEMGVYWFGQAIP